MKRVLIIILIGFFLALTTSSFAKAQVTKDVEGWRGARWGMTEDQILKAFEGEAVRLEEVQIYHRRYASIGIKDFEISGHKFYVHFLMDNKEKTLRQVNIRAKEETLGGIKVVFKSLEQLLVEKYGKPSFENEEEDSGKIVWKFPSTVIELTYGITRGPNRGRILFKTLAITYHPPRKEDLKKI